MDEPFILEVDFQGKKYELEAQLLQTGYIYKFLVTIEGAMWHFEKDDSGEFRALLPFGAPEPPKVNVALLKATAETIEGLLS